VDCKKTGAKPAFFLLKAAPEILEGTE